MADNLKKTANKKQNDQDGVQLHVPFRLRKCEYL